MRRLFGLVLFALAVWVSSEIYAHGVDGAFGGAFAGDREAPEAVVRTRHAAGAFQRAYNKSESRVDSALERER